MPEKSDRPGNRLMDRPEYRLKQQPLTCLPTTSVFEAVLKMSEKNYGAVIVINDEKKVIGIVTERGNEQGRGQRIRCSRHSFERYNDRKSTSCA